MSQALKLAMHLGLKSSRGWAKAYVEKKAGTDEMDQLKC